MKYLITIAIFFLSLPVFSEEKTSNAVASKEEAIKMAQNYCIKTNKDKFWKIDEPKIIIRNKGKFENKIWDIKFPPLENGSGRSNLNLNELTPMQMMPFMMIVFIETGEMKYNNIKVNGQYLDVVLMPAKL